MTDYADGCDPAQRSEVTLVHPHIGYDRHEQRYSGKQNKQLFFLPLFPGPAAHLQVMVERGHLEDASPLSVASARVLEVADLYDVGERLKDKEQAQRDKERDRTNNEILGTLGLL